MNGKKNFFLKLKTAKNKFYDWQHLWQSYRLLVKKTSVVVEVGSSNPGRTTALAERCQKLIGVEKEKKRIPAALCRWNNIDIRQGNWEKLTQSVAKNSADVVIASHVIEHTKNDLSCLNETYLALKKGGHLLFTTPNRKRLARRLIEPFTGERRFPFWEHQREYIEEDLRKLILASKFKKSRFQINGLVFGLHASFFSCFLAKPPRQLRPYCAYWEVIIKKSS